MTPDSSNCGALTSVSWNFGGVPLLGATVGLLGAMAWCHDGV